MPFSIECLLTTVRWTVKRWWSGWGRKTKRIWWALSYNEFVRFSSWTEWKCSASSVFIKKIPWTARQWQILLLRFIPFQRKLCEQILDKVPSPLSSLCRRLMHETTLRLSVFQLTLIEALLLWLIQHEYFITWTKREQSDERSAVWALGRARNWNLLFYSLAL